MKLRDSLFLLLACAGFAACSNDEVATTSADATSTDGVAYLAVKISDVGTGSTRATEGSFLNGTSAEYAVQNAYFYFYDANGIFVTEANVWDGGSAVTGNGNIEFESNTVVVLKNLTSTTYPEYVVTVLNKPTDFTAPKTLDAMEAALADAAAEGIQDDDDYFVMSTTSYGNQGLAKPFVTQLTPSNFSLEPIDLDSYSTPVTIYVERLAVKVTVDVDSSLEATATDGMYKVYATVAGSENGEVQNGIAGTPLYVKINGWTLNAKANHSYIVKNIDESWTNTATTLGTDWSWNDASNYRSYWGMSYNYGLDSYPENVTETTADADGNYTGVSDYLTYVNLSNTTALGGYEYCAENTNTSAIVTANFPSAVTSVLLSATVCDENGNPLDLVRYNGVLFNKADYLAYVLNAVSLNAYTKETVDGEDVYTQIDETYVELENVSDGKVVVTLTSAAESATLYSKSATADADGNYSYTEISDKTDLIDALEGFADSAVAYTGGAMYYNIPIEHLNNTEYDTDEGDAIPEAAYGVVRNHIYQLTITKIENVGKGIYDPEEEIVPNDEDEEFYYVGAKINILSWKIVNQSVAL